MRPPPLRPIGGLLTATLLVTLSSCAGAGAGSSGPDDLETFADRMGGDAYVLRTTPPTPYCLAIGPVAMAASALGSTHTLPFAFEVATLHERLAHELAAVHTASRIVDVGVQGDSRDTLLEAAEASQADLLLRPRITKIDFAHDGANAQGVLSSILWITTWVGGMWTSDNDYRTRLEIEWELVNPHDGKTLDVVDTASTNQSLTFAERNGMLSWAALQSLLIPPVWTSDNTEATALELSGRAVASACTALSKHFKSGMAGRERSIACDLRLESPENGATVHASSTTLDARVLSPHQIESVAVYAGAKRLLTQLADDLPHRDAQETGRWFQVRIDNLEVPLAPGINDIRVLFGANGREMTRTLRIHGGDGDPDSSGASR